MNHWQNFKERGGLKDALLLLIAIILIAFSALSLLSGYFSISDILWAGIGVTLIIRTLHKLNEKQTSSLVSSHVAQDHPASTYNQNEAKRNKRTWMYVALVVFIINVFVFLTSFFFDSSQLGMFGLVYAVHAGIIIITIPALIWLFLNPPATIKKLLYVFIFLLLIPPILGFGVITWTVISTEGVDGVVGHYRASSSVAETVDERFFTPIGYQGGQIIMEEKVILLPDDIEDALCAENLVLYAIENQKKLYAEVSPDSSAELIRIENGEEYPPGEYVFTVAKVYLDSKQIDTDWVHSGGLYKCQIDKL